MLESAGWTVLAARNGDEALQIARDIQYKIDLVVSDIVMPVMSGRQLLREMLAERPTLSVLLISGYDSSAITEDPDTTNVPWLEKPFTTLQLLSAVKAATGKRRPPKS
jgi:two-component system cell cycle sensor histidine kinase/response regulator CckA